MSTARERDLDDQYEKQNDATGGDVPSGDLTTDKGYLPSTSGAAAAAGSTAIPVRPDDEVEDTVDSNVSNTDAQLVHDEQEAIDKGNIIGQRTRGAKPQAGSGYSEGPDEDQLPAEAAQGISGVSDTTRSYRNR